MDSSCSTGLEENHGAINLCFDHNSESLAKVRPTFKSAAMSVRFLSSLSDSISSGSQPSPVPLPDRNVALQRAFNQSVIRQKNLGCSYDLDKVAGDVFAMKREKAQKMKDKLLTDIEESEIADDDDWRSSIDGRVAQIVSKMESLPEREREDVNLVLRKHKQSRRLKRRVSTAE